MKGLLTIIVCATLVVGCASARSVRNVLFEEIQPDGTYTVLRLDNRMLLGEIDESAGKARIVVNASGEYEIILGQENKTDLTGTAAMMIEQSKMWTEFFKFMGSMGFKAAATPAP